MYLKVLKNKGSPLSSGVANFKKNIINKRENIES